MSQKMATIQRRFRRHPAFELVSFSVDPERDTPEVLAAYGEGFGAIPGKWHFLTGDYDAIQAVAVESFKLGHKDNPVHHSTYFTLVDRAGNIRGYFDSVYPDALENLTVQLHRLLTSP
jgi:protein SCO1/2